MKRGTRTSTKNLHILICAVVGVLCLNGCRTPASTAAEMVRDGDYLAAYQYYRQIATNDPSAENNAELETIRLQGYTHYKRIAQIELRRKLDLAAFSSALEKVRELSTSQQEKATIGRLNQDIRDMRQSGIGDKLVWQYITDPSPPQAQKRVILGAVNLDNIPQTKKPILTALIKSKLSSDRRLAVINELEVLKALRKEGIEQTDVTTDVAIDLRQPLKGDYLVTAYLSKTGGNYIYSINMTDLRTKRIIAKGQERTIGSEDILSEGLEIALNDLLKNFNQHMQPREKK